MTHGTRNTIRFSRRKVEADFQSGAITGNGGVMLESGRDRRLGPSARIARLIGDPRQQASCRHGRPNLLRQRLHALCLCHEDPDDHANRSRMVSIHRVLPELFIESFSEAPEELIPDFDATDDRVHGNQAGRAWHGYYRSHCFLPLYVFCNDQLLVSCLRPGNVDGAQHAGAILCLLVRVSWDEVHHGYRP